MADEGTQRFNTAGIAVAPELDLAHLQQGAPVDEAPIDENDFQALLDSPAHNFRSLTRGDVVEGQIVRIDPDEILVDIGLKSEGVIAGRERGSDDDVAALK